MRDDPAEGGTGTETTAEGDAGAQSAPADAGGPPFELTVTRDFVAQHYLTVPDPGPEGEVHSHHFSVELRFGGPSLGEYGYLVDIDAVEVILDRLEDRYRDTLLNDRPEFGDRNPSVERFARLIGDHVEAGLEDPTPTRLAVRVWEDDDAWAAHRRRLA